MENILKPQLARVLKGLSPSPSLRKYSMDYEVKAKVFIKTLNSPAQPFFCLFCLFNFFKVRSVCPEMSWNSHCS